MEHGTRQPAYQTTFFQAAVAHQQRQFRRAADGYWRSFCLSASFGPWAEFRYIIFTGYTSLFSQGLLKPTKQDILILKEDVLQNNDEAIVYRFVAGFALGYVSEDQQHWEAAADYYRQAMAIADLATESELSRIIETQQERKQPVREVIAERREHCAANLAGLENHLSVDPNDPFFQPQLRSDGTYASTVSYMWGPFHDQELIRRVVAGGNECDSCHKTLAELGLTRLSCCTACKAAYYCSRACQRTARRAGHREACRKPKERREGDMMRLVDLEVRPELNGQWVTLNPMTGGK